MPPSSTRQKRLPQRTDYALIPAPLDLSLPLATEKSPLPSIIVTPCSPSSSRDFSIAFLASPPPKTLRERFTSYQSISAPSLRVRSFIFLLIIMLVMVCHLITHSLASRSTHFELNGQTGETVLVTNQAQGWGDVRHLFGRESEADLMFRDIVGASALGLH